MPRSTHVDGFSLEYDRVGAGAGAPAVLLLHGWPGLRGDQAEVAALLADACDVVIPDLRGFGGSDRHLDVDRAAYGAQAQADSLLGLLDELEVERFVVSGYDIGSRIAQVLARRVPERVTAMVISPPLPGAGERVLAAEQAPEWWYQHLHQLPLVEAVLDGRREATSSYVEHFWRHWSGEGFLPAEAHLDALADAYARPGALTASIGWYRAGSGTVMASATERTPDPADRTAVPTSVLWPTEDPLFPPAWSDAIDRWFSDATLTVLEDVGHFVPLEAPDAVADAIRERL